MELTGYIKWITKKEVWIEIIAYVAAAKLMNLEIGQKYPVLLNGKSREAEIIKIDGENVTFRTLRGDED